MAIAARKRFDINEKSVKNEIYSCPPLTLGEECVAGSAGP